MNTQSLFENYQKIFEHDGGLRDLFLFHTDDTDWQTVIDDLRSSPYKVTFVVNEKPQPLPNTIHTIFEQRGDHAVLLRIDEEQLDLHSYFFTYDEIDFDLNPHVITDDQSLSRLLDFIHRMGNLLQKEVVLTMEGGRDTQYFAFDPITGKETWQVPEIERYPLANLRDLPRVLEQIKRKQQGTSLE
jgi:hypothetical protein